MNRPVRPPRGFADYECPSFWIARSENGQARVDDRVATEAKALWPWCHNLAVARLHDGPIAAQLLEVVAAKVSTRLWADERVGENLRGYLARSFVRRLNAVIKKDSRLQFRGLARDLETMFAPQSPDWVRDIEVRLVFEAVALNLDPMGRRMLNLRRAGYDWNHIGSFFGLSPKQARSTFSYRLREAGQQLFGSSAVTEDSE